MKAMILNSSGSVGKSTLVRELFAPRLNDVLIVEVEGQNTSSKDFNTNKKYYDLKVFDNNFENLYIDLIEKENILVDVGASQIENFFVELDKIAGAEMLFDYFIVPTMPTDKAQNDTIKTLVFLQNKGIPLDKIKVIFNGVKSSVEQDFNILIKAAKNFGFDLDTDLYVRENKVFNELGLMRKTLADIYCSDLNYYKNMILGAATPEVKLAYVKIDMANRLGHTAINDLDFVFEKITGQKSNFAEKFDNSKENKKSEKKSPSAKAKKAEKTQAQEDLPSEDDEEL